MNNGGDPELCILLFCSSLLKSYYYPIPLTWLLSNIIRINIMWALHYATQRLIIHCLNVLCTYHMIEMNTFRHLLKTCCILDFPF